MRLKCPFTTVIAAFVIFASIGVAMPAEPPAKEEKTVVISERQLRELVAVANAARAENDKLLVESLTLKAAIQHLIAESKKTRCI